MTLRSSSARPRGATVAITSGKGGVGKTSLTINLAAALAAMGQRVGILDADFGLGNVDVMLGLAPSAHLGAVLAGDCPLEDVIVDGPDGVQVVPAGSGIRAMTALARPQWQRLAGAIDAFRAGLDFLLLDTSPGIADNVIDLAGLTERVMVVTSHEPTAIVDAYAMVKLLLSASPTREVGVVVNAARGGDEAQLVFAQLNAATKRFLGRPVRYYGYVDHDPAVSDAVLEQVPLVTRSPDAPASRSFRRLALRVANWPSRGPAATLARQHDAASGPEVGFDEAEAPRCA